MILIFHKECLPSLRKTSGPSPSTEYTGHCGCFSYFAVAEVTMTKATYRRKILLAFTVQRVRALGRDSMAKGQV